MLSLISSFSSSGNLIKVECQHILGNVAMETKMVLIDNFYLHCELTVNTWQDPWLSVSDIYNELLLLLQYWVWSQGLQVASSTIPSGCNFCNCYRSYWLQLLQVLIWNILLLNMSALFGFVPSHKHLTWVELKKNRSWIVWAAERAPLENITGVKEVNTDVTHCAL
jgi:hypothetical protein